MRILISALVLCLCSCANVTTTTITYTTKEGQSMSVEMPKELTADSLEVSIDAHSGIATVKALKLTTKSVEAIKAQGKREEGVMRGSGKIVEGATQGAVQGVMKGVMP